MKLIASSSTEKQMSPQTPGIPVGISGCLLGHEVRYNGGRSRSRLCQGELRHHFSYRPFCPEVAAGFGVPRPTLRLVGDPAKPRMVFSDDRQEDVTGRFNDAITPYVDALGELDGYILMKNSPSCGLERIKVYRDNGYPDQRRTQGLFSAALQKRYPSLPVEEEGRLHDPRLRENFILRVFAHHHFRTSVDTRPTLGSLMAFHRDYKYVLMAHNQREYRALGRLLASADSADVSDLRHEYHRRFMRAIAKPASRGNHCNVLLHILGYVKRSVQSSARQSILAVIESYRRGEVNLATPLTLVAHYIEQHGSDYIRAQRYLQPYPARLGLNNQL